MPVSGPDSLFGSSLRRYVLVLLPLLLSDATPLLAGPDLDTRTDEKTAKAVTVHDVWSLPGIFGGGMKTTDEYTEGNVFLVLPVISTVGRDGLLSGDLLFIEPYSSWGEQGEVAASLGLGWRHYFTTQSVSAVTKHDGHQASFLEEGIYLGGNVFVDMLDTQFDNQFWQLGVGAEVGTRYLEIRGNYYLPLSDKQLALEQRSRQTFTSSNVSTSQQVTGGDPFAAGNTLTQDVTSTTFATTTTSTTSTTTIEQLFRLYEEGMEGWDVQASLLVPGLDRWADVFLIGGYFSFDNQPFGPQTAGTGNVEGWKAGIEVRPVPAVILNATWYEDERFVGSEWLYGLRLEIPFEMGDLGDGKSFWGRVGDAFTPRRRHLAERLVEPVRRQNQAIQVGNEVEEKVDVNTSLKRVTKVVAQSSQRIVLLEDVVFVNNGAATSNGIGAGNAGGTGTAEQPVDTLQAGGSLAVTNSLATNRLWNVYTQGGVDYPAGVTLPGGGSVKFIGSGMPVVGVGGRSFGTGPAPTVLGVTGIYALGGGTYLGVYGYTLLGGGVLAWNYARNEFVGNTMDGGEHGIGINTPLIPYAEVLAQGNRISHTTFNCIAISAGGTDIDATIIGNTVSNSQEGNGIGVGAASGAVVNATIAGNTLENNALSGIYLSQDSTTPGKGALNATITGNYISGSPLGMDITKLTQEGDMAVTMTGNTIAATGNTAVYASMGGNGTNTYHLLDNHFIKGGVLLEHVDGSGVLDVTVTGNTFTNGYVEAFNANSLTVVNNLIETSVIYQTMVSLRTNRDNATLVVQDNRLYATFGHGIFIDSSDSSDLDVTIEQNTIVAHGPQTRGINLRQVENAVITGSISSNNVYSTGSGIGLSAIGTAGGFTDMTVANNAVTGFEYYGIEAEAGVGAAIDVTIAGNFTSGTAGNGLSLFSQDTTSAFTAVVENNEFQTGGLNVNLVLPTTADITIRGNAITGDVEIREADVLMFTDNTIKDADGLAVYYHEAGSATISRNTMTGNTVNGMVLSHLGASGVVTATFADNTIESAQGTGINIQSSFGGTVSVAISGNDMENTGIAGVYLGASGAGSTLTVTDMSSNTIQGAANFGILMESTGGGALSVSGFDGNSITGTTSGSHLVLFTDATSTLSVLGTVEDNTATPTPNPNGVTLDITGTPTVDFLLNGVHITLPVSVP